MKQHIPNAITCCNLLCGCIATYLAFGGEFMYSTLFILGAAVADFFDGFAARRLGVSSPIGKDLDSLADLVSFGFAPATQLFSCLKADLLTQGISGYWAFCCFLVVAFSALRLAKFNNDPRQHDHFIGLATPANALLLTGICASPLAQLGTPAIRIACYLVLCAASCYLLVCELPMFSLKKGKWPFAFAGFSILLTVGLFVAQWRTAGLFFSMLLYILLSVVLYVRKPKQV